MAKTYSTSSEAQRAKILELLRRSGRHTHNLRANGISHPAARIQELRRQGYDITSSPVTSIDSDGFAHHGVAWYELVGEPEGKQ